MNPSDLAFALRHIATQIDQSSKPSRESVARDLHRLVARISAPVSFPQSSIERNAEETVHKVFKVSMPVLESLENGEVPGDAVEKLSNCLAVIRDFKFQPGTMAAKIQDKCLANWSVLLNAVELMNEEDISIEEVKGAARTSILNLGALGRDLSFGGGDVKKVLELPSDGVIAKLK